MKLLLDENLSPLLGQLLRDAGHDTVHLRDLGQSGATDRDIVELARRQQRRIISGDTDFGELLAQTNANSPSFILLRRQDRRRASQIAALLLANLDVISDELQAGAVVVLDDTRLRIRRLPLRPN